jgi:hypothetical protein
MLVAVRRQRHTISWMMDGAQEALGEGGGNGLARLSSTRASGKVLAVLAAKTRVAH